MRASRLLIASGFAAGLAFMPRPARAQGNQSDIISQHGDALARSTSAQALVPPMPTAPPNSMTPPTPPANIPQPPAGGPPIIPPQIDTVTIPPPSPVMPPGGAPSQRTDAPPIAPGLSQPAPETAPAEGHSRAVLIAAGALIALAMFLWDRRRKG